MLWFGILRAFLRPAVSGFAQEGCQVAPGGEGFTFTQGCSLIMRPQGRRFQYPKRISERRRI